MKVRADSVKRYQMIRIDGRPAEVFEVRPYEAETYRVEGDRLVVGKVARLEIGCVDGRRLNVAPDELVDACE